ncbi:MAG TPA: DUF748 domain-containing protein [Candidatus Binatia bacterium]|nr:DUF748 domain-containing protein [Candidatus Binatia bacterium]
MKRWGIFIAAIVFFLLGAGFIGFRMAVQMLKGKVVEALGPGSEVTELKVRWSSVELAGLNIKGPKGWPAARTLHADRVKIVPSLRSLLTNQIQIASITVENPYLSVVRVPGKLVMLPSLIDAGRRKATNDKNHADRDVSISKIILTNGILEIFDTTVSQPPLKIQLEEINAIVRDVAPVNARERTRFELTALAKGKTRDGKVKVSGWVGTAGRDSSSHIMLESVDLVSLQPYLVKKGDIRVSKGTLDLNLKSEVRSNQLEGIGKMIIRDLELAPSQNYLATFMGLPRSAVIGFLKDNDNAIDVDFTLSGDIRNPNFSLNETLATRVAAGMAGQLGVSIQGVAEGLETLGRKGLEGATGTAKAIGSAFKGLFGGDENR